MKKEEFDVDHFWKVFGIIVTILWFTLGVIGVVIIQHSNRHRKEAQIIEEYEEQFNSELSEESCYDDGYFKVTATVYNPEVGQCDDSPLITADLSVIDPDELSSGLLKWIALSRDLLQHFNYGDSVFLYCKDDPSINGIYEVHDTMNQRYSNYIDILMPSTQRLGKWNNVYIRKIEG